MKKLVMVMILLCLSACSDDTSVINGYWKSTGETTMSGRLRTFSLENNKFTIISRPMDVKLNKKGDIITITKIDESSPFYSVKVINDNKISVTIETGKVIEYVRTTSDEIQNILNTPVEVPDDKF